MLTGVWHSGIPAGAVAPWQYSDRYFDYAIGDGVPELVSRMVLMIRGDELRAYFTPESQPNLRVPAFVFDLSSYGYSGGRVGLHTYAHFAQFVDVRLGLLSGVGAVTEFCENSGSCNENTGLCE